ncbi:MAG: histidine phosphatase family protein [Ruminococcus sp.]|nr:histidine phosphatase family protein [Ruminococcus sp.]
MKLIFARHGQTDYNVAQRVCGASPAMLTDEGKHQAKELGVRLKEKGIDIIVSSPLQRAIDTATLANETLNREIVIDEHFTEWNYGNYEGVDFLGVYDEFQAAKLEFGKRLGGGESVMELAHRVFSGIDGLKERYPDKTVLVVCHGGVCRVVRMYFEDLSMEDFAGYFMDNGETLEYIV